MKRLNIVYFEIILNHFKSYIKLNVYLKLLNVNYWGTIVIFQDLNTLYINLQDIGFVIDIFTYVNFCQSLVILVLVFI